MIKNFISIVLLLGLVFSTLPSHAFAQVEIEDPFTEDVDPVIEDVEGLRAEFNQTTQDPESKKVTFELVLISNIDSDRVKVTWTLKGRSVFEDESEKVRNISVSKGKTYNIPITIIPAGYGVSELQVIVEAFKAESNYLVSVRKNYASNDASEILPITSEYSQAKALYIIKTVGIILAVITGLLFLAFFGFKRFVKWLNKP